MTAELPSLLTEVTEAVYAECSSCLLLAGSSVTPDTLTSQPVKPLSAQGIEAVQCLLTSAKRHRAASRTGDCSVV